MNIVKLSPVKVNDIKQQQHSKEIEQNKGKYSSKKQNAKKFKLKKKHTHKRKLENWNSLSLSLYGSKHIINAELCLFLKYSLSLLTYIDSRTIWLIQYSERQRQREQEKNTTIQLLFWAVWAISFFFLNSVSTLALDAVWRFALVFFFVRRSFISMSRIHEQERK